MAWDYPRSQVVPSDSAPHVRRYLHESPATEEHLAMVAVKYHCHGANNPKARLRYEIDRQFAPYLGLSWHEKFGETADFARLEGEDTHSVSFVLGLRLWY